MKAALTSNSLHLHVKPLGFMALIRHYHDYLLRIIGMAILLGFESASSPKQVFMVYYHYYVHSFYMLFDFSFFGVMPI